ncbi:hypothetical protein Pmar_PMAR019239 [Perkinsus marinus ATCC 50983]|uniref:C3H1-type domain-containing protein n=2 Tax=Perkinsus marinus (strain ATCC 50983 / TXsc) TaxID=423536 RepID=C5KU90_PERM5|nr:hypothetical protein Pmar_PMAR019239 [Perkinsus marinus ATCC 50983]EER12132.1 hypothetical protein Pmar_PMAR019239 [Perkinsus marinus ATCC 50983]|eukprot:XP_002780337.1 hypothetical protein Pmar_PMAR019239 [Perkinsus marinus ATCC 50983]
MMKKRTTNRFAAAAGLAQMEVPSEFDTSSWEILSPQPPGAALSDPFDWPSASSVLSSPYAGPPTGEGESTIRQQLRKTRVCKHFLKGRCHYGASCTFAHYDSELFKKPNLARTKMCTKPQCNDPECTYAHSLEELRQPGEASDMDTARVDMQHEKVLGEQRALLTVHGLMAQTGDGATEGLSPGILPSPSLLPTPPTGYTMGAPFGNPRRRSGHSPIDGSRSRSSLKISTLHALATKNEELRRQVEMSNVALAHLLQVATAQAVPETPFVTVTPPSNVFSQQQQERDGTTPPPSDMEGSNVSANAGTPVAVDDSSGMEDLDADALSQLLASISVDSANCQWDSNEGVAPTVNVMPAPNDSVGVGESEKVSSVEKK